MRPRRLTRPLALESKSTSKAARAALELVPHYGELCRSAGRSPEARGRPRAVRRSELRRERAADPASRSAPERSTPSSGWRFQEWQKISQLAHRLWGREPELIRRLVASVDPKGSQAEGGCAGAVP